MEGGESGEGEQEGVERRSGEGEEEEEGRGGMVLLAPVSLSLIGIQ